MTPIRTPDGEPRGRFTIAEAESRWGLPPGTLSGASPRRQPRSYKAPLFFAGMLLSWLVVYLVVRQ